MEKLLTEFKKDLQIRNYSPLTIIKYAHCLKMFLEWLNGQGITDLKKVGREELRAYSEALNNNPRYSLHYVGSNIRAIRVFFQYLKKSGSIFYDFSVVLREPRTDQLLPKDPLTLKEVTAMLEAPDLRTPLGIRDRAILETFYSSGIRVLEMSNLILLDISLSEGLLYVRQGKGNKDRVVPLGKHAASFIQNYLETVRPVLLAKEEQHETIKTNRVWLTRRGYPLNKCEIGVMVRHYSKKAGVEKQVTPHSFRRTLAVELIRNGCDFLAVKEILGHSNSHTTLKYCALSGVDLKEALKKCHPRYEVVETEDATPHIKSFGREVFR